MPRLGFHEMPWVVVLATGLTLFHSWVLFAELVIDRYGFSHLLPFYRAGNLCPYEPAVALLIMGVLWGLTRRTRPDSLPAEPRSGRGDAA